MSKCPRCKKNEAIFCSDCIDNMREGAHNYEVVSPSTTPNKSSPKFPELGEIMHAAPYQDAHRAGVYMKGMKEAYNIIKRKLSGN